MNRVFSLAALALTVCLPRAMAAEKVDFNYDIRPLISSKCYHCHGPDEKARKAKLRLDMRDDAIKEHESGQTIVPGNADKSELIHRVTSTDRDEVMPPPKEEHTLTAQEIDVLRRWINEGAEYKPHWAFVKPARPAVPKLSSSNSKLENPIDAFVVRRLEKEGMNLSPEADRYALIRRVSLDLTGLPPTAEETDAFVNDPSPDAYEKVVDRLLASIAYGERWAKMWLDLARYADSSGYGSDFMRLNVWPYRDWVINAFNRNMPFDQFTVEQIAGDLLPHPTTEQFVATEFNRNTMSNFEGGTIPEEFRVAAVKDRVSTTGEVWMGLTIGCAQCHSHKFDPISQTDYYRFFGVFNQSEDANRRDDEPTMPLPTPEETAKKAALNEEIAGLEKQLKAATSPELEAEEKTWEVRAQKAIDWQPLETVEIKAKSQATFETLPDGSLLAHGEMPETDTYTIRVQTALQGITAFRLEALPDDSLPSHGPGRSDNGNAALTNLRAALVPAETKSPRGRFVRVSLSGAKKLLALAEVQVFSGEENVALRGTAKQSSTAYGGEARRAIDGKTDGDFFKAQSVSHTDAQKDPWWEVDLGKLVDIDRIAVWNRTDSNLGARLADFRVSILDDAHQPVWEQTVIPPPNPSVSLNPAEGQTIALRDATADFSQSGWDVSKAIDGDAKSGWAFAPQAGRPHAAVFQTEKPLQIKNEALVFTLDQQFGQRSTFGRFRLLATTQKAPVRELPGQIKAILAIAPGARDDAQKAQVMAYFRPLSKAYADLGKQLEARRVQLAAIKPLMLPIMRDLPANQQRETHLLNKGNYLVPMDKVEPGLPAQFSAFIPADAKIDRLTAARWLVSPENPLTARVAVNRFWAQLFGTGIVETEEDFGSQGSLPSHPDLLDWLAVTFMSPKSDDPAQLGLGWDVKAMLRLIVTSATYRQSSKVTPAMLEKDGRNRWLSHAPRRRLEAEAVRDQALALSGLLSHKIGGPSVYPPQPDGIWKVAFNGGQNAYPTSKGEDRYRRGLYTFWRRTMPPPDLTTFDAPSRESCTLRRIPTNTPLQAFVTMNDPVYVECAQALARRMMSEGGETAETRVRFGLRLCLGRPPTNGQVKTLVSLYEKELAQYQPDTAAATKLATEPLGPLPENANPAETAAFTVVANVLLNLDAVLTKN
ncbi:MAG TPA: DUF1553 domain-containing protein [Chthoniobacter sp.]|jgi:hypothetical protein